MVSLMGSKSLKIRPSPSSHPHCQLWLEISKMCGHKSPPMESQMDRDLPHSYTHLPHKIKHSCSAFVIHITNFQYIYIYIYIYIYMYIYLWLNKIIENGRFSARRRLQIPLSRSRLEIFWQKVVQTNALDPSFPNMMLIFKNNHYCRNHLGKTKNRGFWPKIDFCR